MFSSTIKKVDPFSEEKEENAKKIFYQEMAADPGIESPFTLNPDLKEATEGVRLVAEHLKDEAESYKEQTEWKYVAMVIDHYLMYVFIVVCLLGTVTIFGRRLIGLTYEEKMFKTNDGKCLLNC